MPGAGALPADAGAEAAVAVFDPAGALAAVAALDRGRRLLRPGKVL